MEWRATSDYQGCQVLAGSGISCCRLIEDPSLDSESVVFVISCGDSLVVVEVGCTDKKYRRCLRFDFSTRLCVEIP